MKDENLKLMNSLPPALGHFDYTARMRVMHYLLTGRRAPGKNINELLENEQQQRQQPSNSTSYQPYSGDAGILRLIRDANSGPSDSVPQVGPVGTWGKDDMAFLRSCGIQVEAVTTT